MSTALTTACHLTTGAAAHLHGDRFRCGMLGTVEPSAADGTPGRRPMWQRWLLANILGGTLGTLGGAVVAFLTAGVGFGLLIGLGLGIAQRRMLQPTLPRDRVAPAATALRWWVVITALAGILPGWLILFAAVLGASNGGNAVTDSGAYISGVLSAAAVFGLVSGGVLGLLVGAIQGVLVHRIMPSGTRRVVRWSLASGVGWAVGWALTGAGAGALMTAGAVSGMLQFALLAGGSIALLGAWAVNGLSTGRLLPRT